MDHSLVAVEVRVMPLGGKGGLDVAIVMPPD